MDGNKERPPSKPQSRLWNEVDIFGGGKGEAQNKGEANIGYLFFFQLPITKPSIAVRDKNLLAFFDISSRFKHSHFIFNIVPIIAVGVFSVVINHAKA